LIRHQLTVSSPLTIGRIARAIAQGPFRPGSARERLSAYLSKQFKATGVVLAGSGTQALQLALETIRSEGSPEPVAFPAYGCFDLVTAAIGSNVPILLYDLEPATLAPDLKSLQKALDAGARTVVASYLFGYPINWDQLTALCRNVGAAVIEDAAQGLGSTWNDQPGGTFGDLTILSFGRGKGWTGGTGGALLVRNHTSRPNGRPPTLPAAGPLSEAKSVAACLVQWTLGRPAVYGIPASIPSLGLGEMKYREPVMPTSIPAAAAEIVLAHADLALGACVRRQEIAAEWDRVLRVGEGDAGLLVPCRPSAGGTSGFLRYAVLVESAATARRLAAAYAGAGVARPYPRTLSELPEGRRLMVQGPSNVFAGAELLAERLLTLPTHAAVSETDILALAGGWRS
jgi:dTDP-4-amino-4,6-dideoxygalactose transaminase